MSSQPSGKNMKTKHIKAVSQKVKLFRASEPLLSVLMWGINHSVRKSASLISNVRILDDFRSLCIIETRNVLHQTCNSIKTITHDTMNYKNNIRSNSLVCKLQSWAWAQLRVGDRGQRQVRSRSQNSRSVDCCHQDERDCMSYGQDVWWLWMVVWFP